MILCTTEPIVKNISTVKYLWLFLDYDGTLAEFAPTPEDILPNKDLIALVDELVHLPDTRVAIISGRRLGHIQALLPVSDMLIAGTYGLEIQTPDGNINYRLDYGELRPLLDELKKKWEQLLKGRSGFFLEDKGWTIAIHAKDAAEQEAEITLEQAHRQADGIINQGPTDVFRLLGGHRFLECSPREADKKRTVEYVVSGQRWHDETLFVYLGDDDKDEVAFEAVQDRGGIVVAVGDRLRNSTADCWLPSPQAVRNWLRAVLKARKKALGL